MQAQRSCHEPLAFTTVICYILPVTSPISFRIAESSSTFLDPRKGFEPATQTFQVRFDPLTGRSGHFSHFGAINPPPLDLEAYESEAVKAFCPFCPDHRERFTPKFPPEVMPEGRMALGESLLIPNLYPYDIYSAVAIMSDRHVVPLDAFDHDLLYNAFSVGLTFLKRIAARSGAELPFSIMTWNYMPPSGGGLVHPHQQYFSTAQPGNQFLDELRASIAFQESHGLCYWSELVREEQALGQRYIGTVGGNSHWLASFVSMGLLGDVMAVFPGILSIEDVTDGVIESIVSGLLNVFRYYRDRSIYSFNAAWFFGPAGQTSFPSHFRIIPRMFLNTRDYAPDLSFFQSLLCEPISVVLPEDLCGAIRPYFL